MKLELYKTLWGHGGSLSDAIHACRAEELAGLEGPPPTTAPERREFREAMNGAGLRYIAEICTAGSYVPRREASLREHLDSLRERADAALECQAAFLTVIGGCDAWPLAQSVDFFGDAMEIARALGATVSFETHRSRSLFNPWAARDLLAALPEMKLTCDYSHWCVVCERLLDTEPDILELCAGRAHHVHARVGYDQGPQAPHPAAPEYRLALEAHERWWSQIWACQREQGRETTTMTPEFGPDGYLQARPFSGMPAADLCQVNDWMARRLRSTFELTNCEHAEQSKPAPVANEC